MVRIYQTLKQYRSIPFQITVAIGLFGLMFATAAAQRFLYIPNTSPGAGDIDLSGPWKISLSDHESYADPALNDSNWCLISVPDASKSPLHPPLVAQKHCYAEFYPKEQMRNKVYWYRTSVWIPETFTASKPTLFLGNVKDEAWLYWDGQLFAQAQASPSPLYFKIDSALLKPGFHLLAIRTKTGDSRYPGIFHAYSRKIALGDFSKSADTSFENRASHITRTFPLFANFVAFLLVIFLLVRTQRTSNSSFALLCYFGFSIVYSVPPESISITGRILGQWGLLGFPLSALAYSNEILFQDVPLKRGFAHRILTIFGFVSAIIVMLAYRNSVNPEFYEHSPKALALFTFTYLATITIPRGVKLVRQNQNTELPRQLGTLFVLLLILTLSFTDILVEKAVVSPVRYLTTLLTLFIVLLAIEDHITQERRLAFFGRFLRKGLKQLLSHNFKKVTEGEKVFRGRKIPVMTLDMENHTRTTYGMPFGIKRIFQDLWFTTIDHVMENKTFMDKGMGDGSLYYFEEKLDGGSCRAALECALKIRSESITRFDTELVKRIKELLAITPELELPAARFLRNYRERAGHEFWDRSTQVRAVLAYGYADEGLWGLHSSGHYDVEGDLVTLTARLEKHAGSNQIIITRAFYDALIQEWPEAKDRFGIEWRSAELKGIGVHEYGLVFDSAQTLSTNPIGSASNSG